MNVCIANPECTALLECLDACDVAGCENECFTAHMGGLGDSGPVADCTMANCADACG